MDTKYTAILKQDAESWIGCVEEMPGVHCHEHSREALLEHLENILKETLAFNRQITLNTTDICFKG